MLVPMIMIGLAGGACHKDAPQTISATEVPKTLQTAFRGATGSVGAEADAAAQALQNDQQGQALESLERLSSEPGLTDAQREAATQSALAVRMKIREAAAAGDKAAQKFLEQQAASK